MDQCYFRLDVSFTLQTVSLIILYLTLLYKKCIHHIREGTHENDSLYARCKITLILIQFGNGHIIRVQVDLQQNKPGAFTVHEEYILVDTQSRWFQIK